MLEEEIRKIVKQEVEKMLHPLIENIAKYAETNQTNLSALLRKVEDNLLALHSLGNDLSKMVEETSYKNLPLAIKGQPVTGTSYEKPPVSKEEQKILLKEIEKDVDVVIAKQKTVPYKEEIGTEEPEAEPEEEAVEYPREWVKEQEGVLENGETQVWRFGSHTLTVWMHEKKTYCQVDDGEEIPLWTQKALEKIQKQIEKMD